MRILVFDSGIGGLGIAAELRALVPAACLIYLADDAGFPYGERRDEDLAASILRVMAAALRAVSPDMVVVACNTASTVALAALRARFGVPFVGCVPPVKWAASISQSRVIGLLATPATVRRPYLQELIRDYAGDCQVLSHGAPHLAALAEARFGGHGIDERVLAAELRGLTGQPGAGRIDAVALGCTHYPLLLPELRLLMPGGVTWLDPAARVAQQACRIAVGLPPSAQSPMRDTALFTGRSPAEAASSWAARGFHHFGML